MARTNVFDRLRRAARLAATANQHRWSAEETIQRELARRSRRDFLKATSLSAAAASLAACMRTAPPPRRELDVAIVGGGIAGLTCAYRLQQSGIRARVFEAQSRLGGRMFSLRDQFADRHVVELGGELIDSNHAHIRKLASELGLTLDDFELDAPQLSRVIWYFGGTRRSDREVVEAFMPIAAAIQRDIELHVHGEIGFRNPENGRVLDQQTVSAWLDAHGVSGWIRSLLDVAYTTEMGLPLDQQSALNLLELVELKGDEFRVFGESDERYHVRGGNDLVIRELGRRLEGQIETESALEAITQSATGRFTLAFKRDSGARDVSASHLVIAIPLTTLRRVQLDLALPALQRRVIQESGYGTNAKLMIGFSRRLWRENADSDGSTFSDLPYQTSWEASRAQPGSTGILTNFVGGARGIEIGRGTAADQAVAAVADLERVYPGISALRDGMATALFHWPSHPWSLGSYSCPRPGEWTTFGGVLEEPIGRLYFAGEHTSATAQGFMEGGCESGDRVASQLIDT